MLFRSLQFTSLHLMSSILIKFLCFNLSSIIKIASLSSQLPSLSTLLLHGNKMQQISPEILSHIARYFSVDKIGLYCTVLYCTVLYCTVLYCTVLYCTVLYCTVLYCTVTYSTVLYRTLLYSTVLYCTVK